jgi:hypothetical protein
MLLKEHESSRLLQHKTAIEQYEMQINDCKSELENENISDRTKSEIESFMAFLISNNTLERHRMKSFALEMQNQAGLSSFDEFVNSVLAALAELEKVITKLPEDIRKPIAELIKKVRAALEFLKKLF